MYIKKKKCGTTHTVLKLNTIENNCWINTHNYVSDMFKNGLIIKIYRLFLSEIGEWRQRLEL